MKTRERRVALNLRVAARGKEAMRRAAAHRARVLGRRFTLSDAAREAFADYCAKHDPERRR